MIMKRMFVLSMLIAFGMICSCQKQDSAAEAQLAQRKAELDAREKALDEREKAVSEWEKAMTKFRAIPSDLQSRKPAVDPEQAKAEREKRIQQLPPELQALIRDRSLLDARTVEKNRGTEDRAVELQRRLEEARRKKMGAIASPNGEISDTQSSSPSPSPTPE
jgi:chromosome segregation ATPase